MTRGHPPCRPTPSAPTTTCSTTTSPRWRELAFGTRPLCTVLRPRFLTVGLYRSLRSRVAVRQAIAVHIPWTRIATDPLLNITAGGGSTVPTFAIEPR